MLSSAELVKHVGKVMPPENWGHVGWLTTHEVNTLVALRTQVSKELIHPSHMMTDQDLLRFLRARKFDEKEAFKMIAQDLEWRKVFENRLIMGSESSAVVDFCRQGFLKRAGQDKDGRPVLVIKFQYAFPRLIKDMNEIVLFWVAYVQLLCQECVDFGVVGFTTIADLDNFSPSKNFSMAMVKVLIAILQNNYPERLGFLLMLNIPMAFRMGWGMIQPFLDERTKAKIHILGKDIKQLKEYIKEDVLEKEYGGLHEPYPNCDPLLTQFVDKGVVIRTGYFDTPTTTSAQETTSSPKAAAAAEESGKLNGRTFSSKGLDRIRELLVTSTQPMKLLPDSGMKTNNVPKSVGKVTVFGGNGKTGLLVLHELLTETELEVVCFLRSGGSGAPPLLLKWLSAYRERLSVVVGDVLNFNDLDRAIEMSDAVVSCMGSPNRAGGEGNVFYENTARAIVDSMERNGTKRLIVVTAAQAKRMSKAWWDSNASVAENADRHLNWGGHFKYIADMEKYILDAGTVDFTFLRPSQLKDEEEREYLAEPGAFFVGGPALSRKALALCIVKECVLGNKYVNSGVALAGLEVL